MRYERGWKLVLAGLALLVPAGVAVGCGGYGVDFLFAGGPAAAQGRAEIKLPGRVYRGVVRGGHLHAVTDTGRLVAVDLKAGQVKDHGTLDAKLQPTVAVQGARACVTAGTQLRVVDLTTGKVTKTIDAGPDVRGFGFLGDDRLFVQRARGLDVVDLASGKTAFTIEGAGAGRYADTRSVSRAADADLSRGRLYVPVTGKTPGLAVVDLTTGKTTDVIPLPPLTDYAFAGDVHAAGDRVFVVGLRFGYGVWTNHFGYVDVKTRTYHAVKLAASVMRAAALVPGPDGTVFLTTPEGAAQYDPAGRLVAQTTTRDGMLIGHWNGQAVLAHGDTVRLVPLARQSAKAE
jgi:hypothetical protein